MWKRQTPNQWCNDEEVFLLFIVLCPHWPTQKPLEVVGGELRDFEGMTTVGGPWVTVVGVTVAVPATASD